MINIDYKSRTPIYEQIVENIEKYVSLGVLKPNEQIPSIRDMALSLGINPNTVKKAYDILDSRGVIVSISTKGTYITKEIDKVKNDKIDTEINIIKNKIDTLMKLGLDKDEILKRISN